MKLPNYEFTWEYRLCQFLTIVPWSFLFIVLPWPVLLIQPLGLIGMHYSAKRNFKRIDREFEEYMIAKYGSST